VIGAGPIGLAAAAHLDRARRPHPHLRGGTDGRANIRDWAHVRIFTTWEQSVDTASRRLLEASGWTLPDPNALPTGEDLYRHYLKPLSRLSGLSPHIHANARVGARRAPWPRQDVEQGPRVENRSSFGSNLPTAATGPTWRAPWIDASGTWQNPNPLGASGLEADGERAFRDRVAYGMPDVLGAQRGRYADRGSPSSARATAPSTSCSSWRSSAKNAARTKVTWIVRGKNMSRIYGGGENDQLPARGKLAASCGAGGTGPHQPGEGFHTGAIAEAKGGSRLEGYRGWRRDRDGRRRRSDRLHRAASRPRHDAGAAAGARPMVEGVKALGPLIDPNLHSCGSVPRTGTVRSRIRSRASTPSA